MDNIYYFMELIIIGSFMNNIFSLLGAILILAGVSFAKNNQERIEVEEHLFSDNYLINGNPVPWNDVEKRLAQNPTAEEECNSAGNYKIGAIAFTAIGGIAIGFGVSQLIIGSITPGETSTMGPTTLLPLGGGLAILGLALKFFSISNQTYRSAIDIYNNENEETPFTMELVPTGQGIAVAFKF